MRTHVALLRAVNVSGTGKVAMAELRALAERLGFTEAATVLQSGSLVFAAEGSEHDLRDRLTDALASEFGLKTTVIVRTAAAWRTLVSANPYTDEARDDPSHMVVMPLSDAPKPGGLEALRAAIQGREVVELRGKDLYAVYRDGIGDSKLLIGVIEKALGVKTTGRNWNTVMKIAALLNQGG